MIEYTPIRVVDNNIYCIKLIKLPPLKPLEEFLPRFSRSVDVLKSSIINSNNTIYYNNDMLLLIFGRRRATIGFQQNIKKTRTPTHAAHIY